MRALLLLLLVHASFFIHAQVEAERLDKIYFHNGEVADVNVKKVKEFVIDYNYPGEITELSVSKWAIDKIIFRSGREQKFTDKIEIRGEDDWQRVTIIYEPEEMTGLKKKGEVLGKTKGFFSEYTSGAGSDRRAQEKLLKEAALHRCPFVLLVVDKDSKGGVQRGSYGNQNLKKGIAYTY